MLNRIGTSRCIKWSIAPKIASYLFHTNIYADWNESANLIPALRFISKYDEQATKQILQVLNETSVDGLARYNVAKSRIQKIAKYRSTNGPFKTIHQVLDVESFGAQALEKLVSSIAESSSERETVEPYHKPPQKVLNYIVTPALSNAKRGTVNTITSICIRSKYVSWAKIETSGRLLSWYCWNEVELPKKDNPMLLHDLAVRVRNKIPASDVYVTETAPVPQSSLNTQQSSGLSFVQCLQLNTMLATLLATKFDPSNESDVRRWTSIDNFFYLRRQVTARLFHLVVGNETVAARNVIKQIIDRRLSNSFAHILPITIDGIEMGVYEKSDEVTKEALSQALLLSIAFTDLAVNCNPKSLKKFEPREKQRDFK